MNIGHSGGGQFLIRLAAFNPHEAERIVVANAGTQVFPTRDLNFPFGFGGLGLVFSVVGLVLGVFMLILDFDFVEQGIANGLPERESWRASFGLLVSLVWIYTNLLRILAILNRD